MRILALDFETSGLSPERHAPVSLGVAVMDGLEVEASEEWLIGPTLHWKTGKVEREYDVRALEISGASWAKIKASPPPKVIVGHLADFAKKHDARELTVVAFNAPFDLAFYSALLYLASDWHPTERGVKVQPKPPLLGPWHCALMLAREHLDMPAHHLDGVAAHFGFARQSEKHSALKDAVLAGKVFHELSRAGAASRSFVAAGAVPAGEEGA